MIIYEIHATVDRPLNAAFVKFMNRHHIPDMLNTGYFESAEISEEDSGVFVIRYLCKNRALLNRYLEHAADALRRDFVKNFPTGVSIERKISSG